MKWDKVSYDIVYMWNFKKYKLTYMQNGNRHTENKFWLTKGKRGGYKLEA